jgi:nicotinamidase-related amidase
VSSPPGARGPAARGARAGRRGAARHHLVVIDMQRVFADPDSEWATPRFGEIVPRVAELAAAAPAVTFTRFVAPATPKGSWVGYYERFPFARRPPDDPLWDVVPAVGADPARTISATTFGKWSHRLAARTGDATVVLTGVSTECCVVATAVAAADAGASVQVVTDACAGATDASHAAALAVLELFAPQVTLVTADDVRRSWT